MPFQSKYGEKFQNTHGQVLIVVLLLVTIAAFLVGLFVHYLVTHVNFTARITGSAAARSMAESGINYALHQLKHGDWLSRERPFTFESAEIDGKGSFRLTISDGSSDRDIRISAEGKDDYSGVRKTLDVTVANPANITDYLLSVTNLDYDLQPLSRPVTCVFGSDGMAATGVTQELHTVRSSAGVTLVAATDPVYAGILPGSDYVIDASGEMLGRTDKSPPPPNRYFIDYASGVITFSQQDAGRRICIIYDYLRRIPTGSAPVIALPHSPIREGSNIIPEMRIVNDVPNAKGLYQPDYVSGTVRFFEQDAGATIGPRYAFLGSRMTGAIRVNGDTEWHNTNLLYLFGSRGQKLICSGRILMGSGYKMTVWSDNGLYGDPSSWSGRDGLVLQNAPRFEVPAISMERFRHRAKNRGKSGLYFDNHKDIEFADLQDADETPPSSDVNQKRDEIDWRSYMERLYRDWTVSGSDNWHNGTYTPPGQVVDLSSVFSKDPQNKQILIFAEGNVILRGSLPEERFLTVVSKRNIYLDDTPGTAMTSSLTLIAEGNICINLTRLQPQATNNPPVSFYLNCVAIARRGTLGVIPGGSANNRAVIRGSITVNRLYPNSIWAQAFSTTEWLHDPTFSKPPRLPLELLYIKEWDE